MKFNVNVNIKLRDVCLVTAGVVVGAAAISLFNQHNVRQVKKEFNKIVDKETKTIKKEIKNEIKDSIIDETLEKMLDKNATFMAKVDIRLDKYEKELNKMSNEVLNFDARVGKIVNGALRTVAGVVVGRGDDDED